jgi:hypothetical protein
MVLVKQIVDIPLGGLETKIDPKLVPLGRALELRNGEFDQLGAINKRAAYAALTAPIDDYSGMGASVTSFRGVWEHNGELLCSDGRTLYAWSPSAAKWIAKGELWCLSEREGVIGSASVGNAGSSVDVALIGAIACYVWREDNKIRATLVDTITGTKIASSLLVATWSGAQNLSAPRVYASGSSFCVLYRDDAKLLETVVSTAGVVGTTFALRTGIHPSVVEPGTEIDVAGVGGGVGVVVCSVGNAVAIQRFNASGAVGALEAWNEDHACHAVCCDSSGNIYVAWQQKDPTGTKLRCRSYTSALVARWGPVDLTTLPGESADVLAGVVDGSFVRWFIGNSHGTGTPGVSRSDVFAANGGFSDYGLIAHHAALASKPWVHNGAVFLAVLAGGADVTGYATPRTYLVLRHHFSNTRTPLPVAVAHKGYGPSYYGTLAMGGTIRPSSVVSPAASRYLWACSIVEAQRIKKTIETPLPQPAWSELDFGYRPEAAALGDNLYLTGGQLWEYDGTRVVEAGYHVGPEIYVGQNGAGGSITAGTYQVAAVFIWWDAHGQIHYSRPSITQSITVAGGATNKLTVRVGNLDAASIKPGVQIAVYCSAAGAPDVLYEAAVVANGTTDDQTIELTDLSMLTTGRQLYTTGGVVDDEAPPALQALVRKGKRLYGVNRRGEVWYTKAHVRGESARFSPELLTTTPLAPGGDVRIAVLDEALAIVGEQRICALFGDGPSDNLTGNTLSDPRDIATDTGLAAGTPVLSTDQGVWFCSPKGLVLLDRALQVQPIGSPVAGFDVSTCVAASLANTKRQILFTLASGGLVYDYQAQQWGSFRTTKAHAGACVWNGSHVVLQSSATAGVYVQAAGTFEEQALWGSPWVKAAGVQGYKRLYDLLLLGTWKSAHTLTLEVYYDYSDTVAETKTIDLSTGYTAGAVLQVRHNCGRPCEAIRFRLYDSNLAGTKESFSLTAASLVVGVKGGAHRVAPAKTF